MKRVTKWEAKYFTHKKSYYPVPHTGTEFANVNLMRPLPSKGINPEFESTMKEFVEKYRLLRQRTVREETNKEKARALPPAFYTKKEESIKVDLLAGLGNDFNSWDQLVGLRSDKGPIQAPSEDGNVKGHQKTTFLTERMKILPQLRFLDPGGQWAPIFAWISKVRLQEISLTT